KMVHKNNVVDVQRDQYRKWEAGCIEKFKHRLITGPQRFLWVWLSQQPAHIVGRERLRQLSSPGRQMKWRYRILVDHSFGFQETIELPYGDDVPGYGTRAQPAAAQRRQIGTGMRGLGVGAGRDALGNQKL